MIRETGKYSIIAIAAILGFAVGAYIIQSTKPPNVFLSVNLANVLQILVIIIMGSVVNNSISKANIRSTKALEHAMKLLSDFEESLEKKIPSFREYARNPSQAQGLLVSQDFKALNIELHRILNLKKIPSLSRAISRLDGIDNDLRAFKEIVTDHGIGDNHTELEFNQKHTRLKDRIAESKTNLLV